MQLVMSCSMANAGVFRLDQLPAAIWRSQFVRFPRLTRAKSLLVYLGVTHDDGSAEVAWTARKIWDLRLLRDEQSASDVGAPVLVVSQFTLYGDARKGRRPSWTAASRAAVPTKARTR